MLSNYECRTNRNDEDDSSENGYDELEDEIFPFVLPWCNLCKSDEETVAFIENSLKNDTGVERSCKFLIEILLKDFPSDVFFNRSRIIEHLYSIIDSESYQSVTIEVFNALSDALYSRIKRLCDGNVKQYENLDTSNEVGGYARDGKILSGKLHQLPVPYFCLELLQLLLNKFEGHIFPGEHSNANALMKTTSAAISVCFKLLKILALVVSDSIWLKNKSNAISKEIIDKTLMVMRFCSNIVDKYWKEYHLKENFDPYCRINYIRILSLLAKLIKWSQYSQLVPSYTVNVISCVIEDISLKLLYPELHSDLLMALKKLGSQNPDCERKFKLHQNISSICKSLSATVDFFKNCRKLENSPKLLDIIKNSLPSLEYHGNLSIVNISLKVISRNVTDWSDKECTKNINEIVLNFLANENIDIQKVTYKEIYKIVSIMLGGHLKIDYEEKSITENSISFVLHPPTFMEIVSHGIHSSDEEVANYARKTVSLVLRAKLLLSSDMWREVLGALLPSLPILHVSASLDNEYGKSVVKTLDTEIGKCMLIPHIDLLKGNIRLLYTKCLTANIEGSSNIVKYLALQENQDHLLPANDSIRSDMLCSLIKSTLGDQSLKIAKLTQQFYTESTLRQVLTILDIRNKSNAEIAADADPSFKRSALAQLAIMLQQKSLQNLFLKEYGCELLTFYLKASLISTEFTVFPESAKSCVDILRNLCLYNAGIRQWAAQNVDLILNTIRAILLFPNDIDFLKTASQALCLIIFSEFITNTFDDDTNILSVHYTIVQNAILPFQCNFYAKISPHRRSSIKEFIMQSPACRKSVRVSWCVSWFGGVNKVNRWPYILHELFSEEYFTKDMVLTDSDLQDLKTTCPIQGCSESLYQIQNAISHSSVTKALQLLSGYVLVADNSGFDINCFSSLPWCSTFKKFLESPPVTTTDYVLFVNVLEFFIIFCRLHSNKQIVMENSLLNYILDSFDNEYGLISILQFEDPDLEYSEESSSKIILKKMLVQTLNSVIKASSRTSGSKQFDIVFCTLSSNLRTNSIQNCHSLAYVGSVLECLCSLTNELTIETFDLDKNILHDLIKDLFSLLSLSYMGKEYSGFKGYALVQNCFMILCHLLDIYIKTGDDNELVKIWCLTEDGKNLISVCLLWYQSCHILHQTLAVKLMSGLCSKSCLINKLESNIFDDVLQLAITNMVELTKPDLLRTEAANLLYNILINKRTGSKDLNKYRHILISEDFFSKLCATLKTFCGKKDNNYTIGANVPLNVVMSEKKYYEVSLSKNNSLRVPSVSITKNLPLRCPELIIAITDVIYSIIILNDTLPDALFECDILRILFSCLFLEDESEKKTYLIKGSIGRILHISSKFSQEALLILLNTRNLMIKLFNFVTQNIQDMANNSHDNSFWFGWKWMIYLTGSLITPLNGFKMLLSTVSEEKLLNLLQNLTFLISDNNFTDMSSSALFCLTGMFNNAHFYNSNEEIAIDFISLLDKAKISPHLKSKNENTIDADMSVISEKLCLTLINIYKLFMLSTNFPIDNSGFELNHVSACLASLLGCSDKAKHLALKMKIIQDQVVCLNNIQYNLTPEKLKNVLKERSHNYIQYINCVFQTLNNNMIDCPDAKEMCISFNMLVPIKKMWDLCIVKKKTRLLVIELLATITNNCLKASNSMCQIMGSSSLLKEVCDLISKEINLVSRVHSLDTFKGCYRILENVSAHQHCRSFLIKSDVFNHLNKIHPALTKRQEQWKEIELIMESFALTISKYPEGQVKLAEYFPVMCALAHQADFTMLSVIRNCAFNSTVKSKMLLSADVLSLFLHILDADESIDGKIMVATSLWALGANNTKMKLSLRSVGLTLKLNDCLHRLKYISSDDVEHVDKAVQIISNVVKAIA